MADRKIEHHYLTLDEAVKYIKNKYRKGVAYFISVDAFLYTRTPDECAEGENARGYNYPTNIRVSQRDAIKFVCSALEGRFLKEGCRIHVSDHTPDDRYPGAMFIG